MPGRPPLAGAVLPISISENRSRARIAQAIFSLADAKDAIGLEPSDATDDADLLQQIDNAQAILERLSGLALGAETCTAEWCLPGPCAVLKINRSDVQDITAVQELDAGGAATTLASGNYEVIDYLRQAHIRRTDGETFRSQGGSIAVIATFTRGVVAGEQASRHVNMAMRMLLQEAQRGAGIMTDEALRQYRPFMRIISAMQGNNWNGKPVG